MENYNQPAFPPQVAQDNLGRIVAPIPGISKLEYFSLHLYPFYLELSTKTPLMDQGKHVTAAQAAIIGAKKLFEELQKINDNEKDTLQIVE